MIKVLIVDDHQLVRNGIKRILAETDNIVVTGEAENGVQALDMIDQNEYDVILLDISLPHVTGIEVLSELRKTKENVKVLILSMHPEEQYATHCIRLGASGYLTKKSAPEELIAAINKVASGKKYITQSLAENLAYSEEEKHKGPPHERLASREHQVFLMIAQGKATKLIAEKLCLSVKTVSTYRTRILEKMGMKSNADLIYYAIKNNLID